MTKEEHELLINELVKETQENHKALLVMKGALNSARTLQTSTSRVTDVGQNQLSTPTDVKPVNENIDPKRGSVLEISDFNGIDNDVGLGDGILEDLDHVESEEEIRSQSFEDEEEEIDEINIKPEQEENKIKETDSQHKDSDQMQSAEEMDVVEDSKADREKEMEDKFKKVLRPLNSMMSSTSSLSKKASLLNKEAKQDSSMRRSATIDSSNRYQYGRNSVTRSTLVMEKIMEDRYTRLNSDKKKKPMFLINETTDSEETGEKKYQHEPMDDFQKLKKEYFKLTIIIKAMQERIRREDYNVEEIWAKVGYDLDIDQYSSFVANHLDEVKEDIHRRRTQDASTEFSSRTSKRMNAEEYSNLAEMISIKAEIYQNILKHQAKYKRQITGSSLADIDSEEEDTEDEYDDIFEDSHPLIRHIKWAYYSFCRKGRDLYRYVI
mmetsp:Transcript_26122/g.25982  ORF Transcript_26122/g.25982 Transcript_26122/m.25982 type:complete len:437 (+) Transcript_26122:756-2066(+)